MTRRDKLISMKMQDLVKVAKNLGIKVNPKAAKIEAVEKILTAEQNEVDEVMQQKKDLGVECPKIDSYEVVNTTEIIKEIEMPVNDIDAMNTIDPIIFAKFVKKAQKLITSVYLDSKGYHVSIEYHGKTQSYVDKNLQNIRSAIGHIYRGEVEL